MIGAIGSVRASAGHRLGVTRGWEPQSAVQNHKRKLEDVSSTSLAVQSGKSPGWCVTRIYRVPCQSVAVTHVSPVSAVAAPASQIVACASRRSAVARVSSPSFALSNVSRTRFCCVMVSPTNQSLTMPSACSLSRAHRRTVCSSLLSSWTTSATVSQFLESTMGLLGERNAMSFTQ
jgi:hypothetical protein